MCAIGVVARVGRGDMARMRQNAALLEPRGGDHIVTRTKKAETFHFGCAAAAWPSTRLTRVAFVVLAMLLNAVSAGAQQLTPLPSIDYAAPSTPYYLASQTGEDEGESGLAQRVADLESKYADLSEANSELESALKTYAESGHGDATMSVNGRIHFDMWGFPDDSIGITGFESARDAAGDPFFGPQDRIGFRRLRFGVKGDIWENMLYKCEMEFAGGNDVEFRDAYFGFTDVPFMQEVLLGNQKRPYGLDHLNSSRYNVFMERPFIVEAFNQDARRLGICAYSVSDDEAWNWRYGVYNQRLVQDEGNYISDHWQMQVAGRLANTIWYDECSGGRGYAHWAISGSWADTDPSGAPGRAANENDFRTRAEARHLTRWLDTGAIAGGDDYLLSGLEGVVNVGPVQVVGEYLNVWSDRLGAATDLHFTGGYVYVAYFLTGEHMPWSRSSGTLGRPKPFENFFLVDTCNDGIRGGWGAWQIAARWSMGDLSDDDIQGGVGESVTFGVNWYWNPYARMQFNYGYGNVYNNDLNADLVTGVNFGHYQVLGARFMVDF